MCQEFSSSWTSFTLFGSGCAQSAARSLTALKFNSLWEEADSWFQMGIHVLPGCPRWDLQLLKHGVCQQGSPGCPGTEALYDSPCRLLKGIANLWLQVTQIWWEGDGGQDMISLRMAWISNPVLLDCRRLLLLKPPQGSTLAIITAQPDMSEKL